MTAQLSSVTPDQMKLIEFWFALEEAGWDPMLDSEDEAFVGKDRLGRTTG